MNETIVNKGNGNFSVSRYNTEKIFFVIVDINDNLQTFDIDGIQSLAVFTENDDANLVCKKQQNEKTPLFVKEVTAKDLRKYDKILSQTN